MLDDLKSGHPWLNINNSNTAKKSYFQNATLYVGNDAENATKNTPCQGSPFLDINDVKNYLDDPNTNNGSNKKPWKYGDEAWCNLEGRYLHVIANPAD